MFPIIKNPHPVWIAFKKNKPIFIIIHEVEMPKRQGESLHEREQRRAKICRDIHKFENLIYSQFTTVDEAFRLGYFCGNNF